MPIAFSQPPPSIGYFGLSGARVGNVPQPVAVTGSARVFFSGAAPTISAPNPATVVSPRPVGVRFGGAAPTLTQIGVPVNITGVPTGVRFGTVPATVVAPNPEKVITWSPPISMRGTFAFAFQELKQDFTMQLPAPAGVRFGTMPATVVAQKTGFFTFKYNNFGLNVGDEGAVIYTEGGMRTEWLKTLVHPQADSGKIYRSYLDKGKTVYEYYLQRDLDGSGTNQWEAGSSFVNTGKVGDGFIIQYANYGITRTGQTVTARTGPTMAGHVRTGTNAHDIEERWVIGNLKGYYDYGATTFGFAAGDRTGPWISVDATNGIRMMRNADIKAHIRANGTWRFNGDGSQYIDWNGTTLTVAGNINVISGSVPWTTLNGVPGPGVNLLQNPLFDSSTKGWTFNNYNGATPAATAFANGVNLVGWCLPGINTVWASITGGAGSGNLIDLGSNITDVRVTAGDMIEWSVYSGAHRCTVYAYVYFYNADQVNIGFSGHPSTAFNAAEKAGGTVLSGYKRLWGIVQAPAGSVYARLMLRVMAPNAGEPNSYGFFVMPYLGRCTTGQTQPSPWSNSGTRGLFTAPVGDGLHLGPTHMGFYSSGQWRTYMDDQGSFVFRNAPSASAAVSGLRWNPSGGGAGVGRLEGGTYAAAAGPEYGAFTPQWYTDTTGAIAAGGGKVVLDSAGMRLASPQTAGVLDAGNPSSLEWRETTTSGALKGRIYTTVNSVQGDVWVDSAVGSIRIFSRVTIGSTNAMDTGITVGVPNIGASRTGSVSISGKLNVSNTTIDGTAGRNYFKDSEKSSGNGLRVGSAWLMYGIYAEDGACVVGGAGDASGITVSLQNGMFYLKSDGMYATNWIRSVGNYGLYFQTHGGGWQMTDATWLRSYNDKSIYTGGTIKTGAPYERAVASTTYVGGIFVKCNEHFFTDTGGVVLNAVYGRNIGNYTVQATGQGGIPTGARAVYVRYGAKWSGTSQSDGIYFGIYAQTGWAGLVRYTTAFYSDSTAIVPLDANGRFTYGVAGWNSNSVFIAVTGYFL